MAGAIVVTGACRTGTSLMMQTLRLLGVPIVGLEHHPEFPDDGFHPHGAWDLPYVETLEGIRSGRYDDTAIKLFGLQLSRSDREAISKVVICRRQQTAAVASAERMCRARGFLAKDVREAYERNYVAIGTFTELCRLPTMSVQFELMLVNPAVQFARVAEFLGIAPTSEQFSAALSNVIPRERA